MSSFGKSVKAIKISDDNRNFLVGRLDLSPMDEDFKETLPTGWYVVMPFGVRGVHFWTLLSPEEFEERINSSHSKPLANGFVEVLFK